MSDVRIPDGLAPGVSLIMVSVQSVPLHVGFIDIEEDETDLGLSFAIYDDGEYTDSLMLIRSVFDMILDKSEQGVRVNYDEVLTSSESPILLQEVSMKNGVIEMAVATHRFSLNISKLEQSEIEDIKRLLKKLNYDDCFKLSMSSDTNTQ